MMPTEPEGTRRYSTSTHKRKGKSRESEIALLEKISKSLDTYIDNPLPLPSSSTLKTKHEKSAAVLSTAASDASKNAAKYFLAAKTLVKTIAKACAQEHFTVTGADSGGKSNVLFDALVEKYKAQYPSLTKNMLVDGIVRHEVQDEDTAGGSGAEGDDAATDDVIFSRITVAVDVEMSRYHEKIEALKKSRERAASEPEPSKPSRKRKAEEPKQRKKSAEEIFLLDKVVANYADARAKHENLPSGAFEALVEETKRQHGMESFQMSPGWASGVRRRYNQLIVKKSGNGRPANRAREIFEDVYQRYSDAKKSHGEKLPAGTFASIIEDAQREYDLGAVKPINLKMRCQTRFTRENPQFDGAKKYIGQLSEEEKKGRKLLLNEIVLRYVREKEAKGWKMADGTLDRIIRETKNDLGLDAEVTKGTIRDRLRRKVYHIEIGGTAPPYDAIDAPLVATINTWLNQGISVTREQGLDLAKLLQKGKQDSPGTNDSKVQLDVRWWRKFLARNKSELLRLKTISKRPTC